MAPKTARVASSTEMKSRKWDLAEKIRMAGPQTKGHPVTVAGEVIAPSEVVRSWGKPQADREPSSFLNLENQGRTLSRMVVTRGDQGFGLWESMARNYALLGKAEANMELSS